MKELEVIDQNTTYEEDITTIKDVITKSFLVTGKILLNIQDGKKYKDAGYKTFEEAIKTDLGVEKRHAYYLMCAAEIYENVNNCSQNLPTAESQIRPLIGLDPEQQREIWQEVAVDGVPTAKVVKEAVDRKYPKQKKKKATKSTTVASTNTTITDEVLIDLLKKDPKKCADLLSPLLGPNNDTYGEIRIKLDSARRKISILQDTIDSHLEMLLALDEENHNLKKRLYDGQGRPEKVGKKHPSMEELKESLLEEREEKIRIFRKRQSA